jgi:hypothetical protein
MGIEPKPPRDGNCTQQWSNLDQNSLSSLSGKFHT